MFQCKMLSIFPDNKKCVVKHFASLSVSLPLCMCVCLCVKERRSILACTVEVVDPDESVYRLMNDSRWPSFFFHGV